MVGQEEIPAKVFSHCLLFKHHKMFEKFLEAQPKGKGSRKSMIFGKEEKPQSKRDFAVAKLSKAK